MKKVNMIFKHILRSVFLTILMAVLVQPAVSQSVSKVGTTASTFLKLGVSSRPLSMGGAFTAVADDVSALYWNPAGIAGNNNVQALFDHTEWFLDIDYEFIGGIIGLGRYGTVGATISFLHMNEMEITTTHQPDGTGEYFNAGSYAATLSYGKKITDRFSLGITTKYINEYIYNSSAGGFALDIGTKYATRIDGLILGMSISNFGTKMQMGGRDLIIQTDLDPTLESDPEHVNAYLDTDKFDLPLLFRFGIAYSFSAFNPGLNITVAADANHPNDNTESLNIGTEISFKNVVFVRGGIPHMFQRDAEETFTLGAGVKINLGSVKIVVDYAYHEFGRLGVPQKITISLIQ